MRHPDLRDCVCCMNEFLPRAFASQELYEFREALLISDTNYVPVICDACLETAVKAAPRNINPPRSILTAA